MAHKGALIRSVLLVSGRPPLHARMTFEFEDFDRISTFCTISCMRTISTTDARKRLSEIVEKVKATGRPIAIGRRNKPEVMIVRMSNYNPELSDVTNLNMAGGAFDFLWDEPDLYSDKDLKWRYGKKTT